MAEQWLSIVEYARTFSVSDMTVRRRIKTGKLHAVLKEGKYYIPVAVDRSGNLVRQRGSQVEVETRSTSEISVVKAHPSAQRTYGNVQFLHGENKDSSWGGAKERVAERPGVIPSNVRAPLMAQATATVEAQALLEFCEGFMKKMTAMEMRLEDSFRSKAESLEMQIRNKNLELGSLRQQIEDLQVLVKILEKRSS